jgi:hypothetical protein
MPACPPQDSAALISSFMITCCVSLLSHSTGGRFVASDRSAETADEMDRETSGRISLTIVEMSIFVGQPILAAAGTHSGFYRKRLYHQDRLPLL